jgi:hypothetical protein
VRHAWYAEHKEPIGSFSEFGFVETMTPKKKSDPIEPSTSWDDYNVPTKSAATVLKDKTENFCDLCEELPNWCR